MTAQLPVVVGVVLLHGAQDGAVAGVEGGERERPAAEPLLQIGDVVHEGVGRLLGVAALVDPVVDAQAVDAAAFGHELPQPDGAGVRLVERIEAALDHRDVDQADRQAGAAQRVLEERLPAPLLLQPRRHDGAAVTVGLVELEVAHDARVEAHRQIGQLDLIEPRHRRRRLERGRRRTLVRDADCRARRGAPARPAAARPASRRPAAATARPAADAGRTPRRTRASGAARRTRG